MYIHVHTLIPEKSRTHSCSFFFFTKRQARHQSITVDRKHTIQMQLENGVCTKAAELESTRHFGLTASWFIYIYIYTGCTPQLPEKGCGLLHTQACVQRQTVRSTTLAFFFTLTCAAIVAASFVSFLGEKPPLHAK